jgi:hypothetical protein
MENHDEERAASVFGQVHAPACSSGSKDHHQLDSLAGWHDKHAACATLTFTSPGLRFVFEGQRHGLQAFNSMHRSLRPVEQPLRHPWALAFYNGLLSAIRSCPELKHDSRDSARALVNASQVCVFLHNNDIARSCSLLLINQSKSKSIKLIINTKRVSWPVTSFVHNRTGTRAIATSRQWCTGVRRLLRRVGTSRCRCRGEGYVPDKTPSYWWCPT